MKNVNIHVKATEETKRILAELAKDSSEGLVIENILLIAKMIDKVKNGKCPVDHLLASIDLLYGTNICDTINKKEG